MAEPSNTIKLTQEAYQQRIEATDLQNSQAEIRANYVGWNSIQSQTIGFEVATDLPWIDWRITQSVLDVGCGYGQLLDFLVARKQYQGAYWGIDIMAQFIELASQTYQHNPNTHFWTGDFMTQDWNQQRFDVGIAIGCLGVSQDYPDPLGEKSRNYAQELIQKLIDLSNSAVSLYFPNADNIEPEKRKPRMAYYSVSEIEAMVLAAANQRCQGLTFVSFPTANDVKTMAHLKLRPPVSP
jgi:SAM-dependent methyltransferase